MVATKIIRIRRVRRRFAPDGLRERHQGPDPEAEGPAGEGKGDVDAYFAKAEAYFAGYKWDHKGHTNSFSQLMNTDIVIREQDGYLKQTGGSWSKDSVPPGTPKAKILEGYLQNAERCIQKESMGKFNEMDLATREEWKAIVCTQGSRRSSGRPMSDARTDKATYVVKNVLEMNQSALPRPNSPSSPPSSPPLR